MPRATPSDILAIPGLLAIRVVLLWKQKEVRNADTYHRVHEPRRRRPGTRRSARGHRWRVSPRRLVNEVLRSPGNGANLRRTGQEKRCPPPGQAHVSSLSGSLAAAIRRRIHRLDQRSPEVRRFRHAYGRGHHVEADDDHPRRRLFEHGFRVASAAGRIHLRLWERNDGAGASLCRPRRSAPPHDRAYRAWRRQDHLPAEWCGADIRARLHREDKHGRAGLPLPAQTLTRPRQTGTNLAAYVVLSARPTPCNNASRLTPRWGRPGQLWRIEVV